MKASLYIVHVLLPLLVGSTSYLYRNGSADTWIAYSFPDGLWLYAFVSTLYLIWRDEHSGRLWIWPAVVLSFVSEVFQQLQYIPGTFDWGDILAYILAAVTALYVHYPRLKPLII